MLEQRITLQHLITPKNRALFPNHGVHTGTYQGSTIRTDWWPVWECFRPVLHYLSIVILSKQWEWADNLESSKPIGFGMQFCKYMLSFLLCMSFIDLLMFNQNVITGSFSENHRFLCDNICHLVHLQPAPPKSSASLHSLLSARVTSQNLM